MSWSPRKVAPFRRTEWSRPLSADQRHDPRVTRPVRAPNTAGPPAIRGSRRLTNPRAIFCRSLRCVCSGFGRRLQAQNLPTIRGGPTRVAVSLLPFPWSAHSLQPCLPATDRPAATEFLPLMSIRSSAVRPNCENAQRSSDIARLNMEINNAKPGNFCWFELATSDQPAAKKFYGGLFGWTANDAPMGPDAFYTTFQLRGKKVGAAYAQMPDEVRQGVPPHWATYVTVTNVDQAVAKAKSLGGTVMAGPMDVAEHGRMAVLHDPTGAAINLWQVKQHQGVALWGEVGTFCWSELLTRDTAAATKFYTALFGWTTKVKIGRAHV